MAMMTDQSSRRGEATDIDMALSSGVVGIITLVLGVERRGSGQHLIVAEVMLIEHHRSDDGAAVR